MKKQVSITVVSLGLVFASTVVLAKTDVNSENNFEQCVVLEKDSSLITPTAAMQQNMESKDYFFAPPKLIQLGLPDEIKPHGERVFIFSPRHLQWAAYDANGDRVAYGKANGGSRWCRDVGRPCTTPRGVFRVHTKGSSYCKSSKYPLGKGGAPMPYCMFFKGGYAIHGSPYIGNKNSSHGCIRVQTDKARWLHQNFINKGTKVVVWPY